VVNKAPVEVCARPARELTNEKFECSKCVSQRYLADARAHGSGSARSRTATRSGWRGRDVRICECRPGGVLQPVVSTFPSDRLSFRNYRKRSRPGSNLQW